MFGTAIDSAFDLENLPKNEMLRDALQEAHLEDDLFAMGKDVAQTTIELFGDLDPDNPFFDQLTYMSADDLPEYKEILSRIGEKSLREIGDSDRLMIMRLPLAYTEEINRLGLLTDELKQKLLKVRKNLRQMLEDLPEPAVGFYEPDTYNSAASIQDNVLLGRVSPTVAEGIERVSAAIRELLDEMELTDDVFRIGLTFNIGSGGKRLSDIQRQKLHLARILLKKPDILIVNQGMNTLGGREQGEIIDTVLQWANEEANGERGVIWVPVNLSFAERFDRVLVFENGELVGDGTPTELQKTNPTFQALVS